MSFVVFESSRTTACQPCPDHSEVWHYLNFNPVPNCNHPTMPGLLRNRSYRTATAQDDSDGNGQHVKLDNVSPSPPLSPGPTEDIQDIHGEKQGRDPAEPGPPPNGGTLAWLQVLGAFFLNFNTWYVPLSIQFTPRDSNSLDVVGASSTVLASFNLTMHRIPSPEPRHLTSHGLAPFKAS